MRDVTAETSAHMKQLRDEFPWIWLYEIEAPTDPKTRYRLTNFTKAVAFGTTSGGAPITYSPFPIVHSQISSTIDGDLPKFQLTCAVFPELLEVLNQFIGLTDSPIVVRLVHINELDTGAGAFESRGEIQSCAITSKQVSLSIGAPNLMEAIVPPLRYTRDGCNHERYGDSGCGYDLTNATLASAFPTCPKDYDACAARGDAEVSAGLARQHPQRIDGFRSIPRR